MTSDELLTYVEDRAERFRDEDPNLTAVSQLECKHCLRAALAKQQLAVDVSMLVGMLRDSRGMPPRRVRRRFGMS